MTLKRIGAYIIDYGLVFLFLTMLLQIRFLNPRYEEYEKSSEVVQEIVEQAVLEKDIAFEQTDEYKEAAYNLQKNSLIPSIMTIVIYLGYYVWFTIATHGQTLGKKLFKIKIADYKDRELKWYQVLLRQAILYNLIFQGLLLIILALASKEVYFLASTYLNTFATIILYTSVLMLLLKKDKRTIHDILANTKVIAE